MRASDMPFRLTLEAPAETVVAGVGTPAWPVQDTVWGSMRGLGGSADTLVAEGIYAIGIRYRTDIKPTWRFGLVGTNRKFRILKPPQDPDGRRVKIEITVQEGI